MTGFSPGIIRGAQAFAQLHNGNFFVGRVRKVIPEELILDVRNGEISFIPGDLQKLLPLAEAEARILRSGPDGYVRLKNKNRIWGRILENLPDVVTIQTGESRIVVPKIAIDEVSKKPVATIRLGKEEEDWSDEHLPAVETSLPVPDTGSDKEVPRGTVRVPIGPLPAVRAENLRKSIRDRLPGVLPGGK